MAMFNRATNVAVHGGSFFNVMNGHSPSGLDKLIGEVAPNAILNAGGRADEVRCFPGTREEVIGKLEKFMDDDTPGRKRMMWLSGPAGAGKSAIFQTVAERRSEQGKQAANYFFFRGDTTRSHSKPLVATLVYQLRAFYPALNELLSGYLTESPLICKASIEKQFKQLIACPFQTVQQSASIQCQIVLIIDGLDECNNDEREQDQILVALHSLAHAENSPFLILVSSRAESQLVMSFNHLGSSVESIFLNEDYQPRKDIRHFVVAKFADIKKAHHLARTLGEKWPTAADIDAIINKSSGHFIYAATVMRYIEHSPESPALSLVTILEMQSSVDHNPLAHLDAVYSYIFSKARNIRAIRLILYARECSKSIQIGDDEIDEIADVFGEVLKLAGYTDIHVQSFFGDLTAIIKVVPELPTGNLDSDFQLEFYHASLDDYLKDKSRSKIYYVCENEITAELASMCLRNTHKADSIEYTVQPLRQVEKPTPELTKSFLHASTKYLNGETEVLYLDDLIAQIERLYWEHDKDQFKVLLQHWSHFVYVNKVNKFNCSAVGPKNPDTSWYYKQYWMAQGHSGQEPQTLPDSASMVVASSNVQIIPANVSPDAAISKPVPNPSDCKPGPPPRDDSYNTNRTGTVAGTAAQRGIVANSGQSHFLSSFHELFGSLSLRRKVTRGPSRTSRPINVHKEEEEGHGSGEYNDGPYKLSTIRVKIYYQGDIRGMTLNPDAPFSEFVDNIVTKFSKSFDDLSVTFKDQDGDKITLRDKSDYEHAIETVRQHSKGKVEAKLEIWCQDRA